MRNFSDHLSKEKKELLNWWLEEFVRPEKHYNHQQSSYRLKHLFEDVVGLYLSNGQLKMGMLKAGFKPLDQTALNWNFKIKKVDIQSKVISFYDWCIAINAHVDNAAGYLAKDMRGDRDFPKTVSNKRIIIYHLKQRKACKEAIDTFNRLWKRYEDEVLNTNRTIA